MLETWRKTGFLDMLLDAYNRGVIIAGLSAGAICWFENMYTDSAEDTPYKVEYSVSESIVIHFEDCNYFEAENICLKNPSRIKSRF